MFKSPRRIIPGILILAVLALSGCASSNYVPASEAAAAYYNLGNAYSELGRHQDAAAAFIKALELDPELMSAGFNLARVYIILGNYDQSLEQLDELLAEDPSNRSVLETKAWVFHMKGDDETALQIYNSVLDEFSGSRNSLYNAGVLSAENGEFSSALEKFEKFYQLYPDEEGIAFEIAKIKAQMGDYDEASDWIDKYMAGNPGDYSAQELAGDILTERKLYADAVKTYRTITDKASEDNTENIPDDNLLGRVYFKTAEILLQYMEDAERGLEALEKSAATGWKDDEYYKHLLSAEDESWYSDVFKIIGNEESAGTEAPAPDVD